MRFLLDENIGKKVAIFLQLLGHTSFRIKEINPGVDDFEVLSLASAKKAILITSDKDFGELIFKEKQHHHGVILLRLKDQSSENKIRALSSTLNKELNFKGFMVITEKSGSFAIRNRK